ncbi:MAG TPA: tyrosinase family protein [Acidobacteriaceae bacterium]
MSRPLDFITRRAFTRGVAAGLSLAALPQAMLGAFSDPVPNDCAPPPWKKPIGRFAPDTKIPIEPRKSAFSLTAAEAARLQSAYDKMRQLTLTNPLDPRGWMQQAHVHCWYCGGGQNGQAGQEIHGGWWFFPWHRCYLFMHERILGKLIGDDTLRLAYWDWNIPARAKVPPVFMPPPTQCTMMDAFRGATTGNIIPVSYVGATAMQNALGSHGTNFFGSDPSLPNSNGGSVENGPHGIVHVWTGQPSLQNPNGVIDMGVLATAAQDPLFFAHHANIDRLWDVWLSMQGNANLTAASWLTHRWTFYNENAELVSISVADTLNHKDSLRYTYASDTLIKEFPGLQNRQVPKAAALHAVKPLPLALPAGGVTLNGAPDTRQVALSAEHSANFKALSAGTPNQYVLHIEGVVAPPGGAPVVRVFIDKPDANAATSVEDPHFVGYFSIVPHHATGQAPANEMNHPRNYTFELRRNAEAMKEHSDAVAVTLVPVAGENKQPDGFKLTYQKAYLAVE